MPMRDRSPMTIQVPSREAVAYLAISRLPTTKPTEVKPSWRPYSNSVACSTSDRQRQEQDVPQPERRGRPGAPSRSSERRIGVSDKVATPSLRFSTTTPTLVSSSALDLADLDAEEQAGREEEGQPRRCRTASRCRRRRQEAGSGEPDGGRAERADRRNELAEASSSSDAISGRTLSHRVEELRDRADEHNGHVQQGDVDRGSRNGMSDDDAGPEQVRDEHDLLAVEAVDEDARDQPDEQRRDRGRDQHQADVERRVGVAEDEDAGGEVGQRRADRRDELGRSTAGGSRASGRSRTSTARGPVVAIPAASVNQHPSQAADSSVSGQQRPGRRSEPDTSHVPPTEPALMSVPSSAWPRPAAAVGRARVGLLRNRQRRAACRASRAGRRSPAADGRRRRHQAKPCRPRSRRRQRAAEAAAGRPAPGGARHPSREAAGRSPQCARGRA